MVKLPNKDSLSANHAPQAAVNEIRTNEELIASQAIAEENEEKYRDFYDNAPISYQSLDATGCFIDVNLTWLTTLGYERNDVIGKWFGDFLHIEDVDHFKVNFPAFMKQGYVSDVQFRLRKKDNTFIHVSYEGRIGYTPDGQFKQTYCVFKDVTELYAAQKTIYDEKERFSSLLDNLEAGIVLHAPDSSIIRCNPRAAELLGLSNDKMIGKVATDQDWKFIGEDNNPLLPEEYPVSRIISTIKPINNQILGIKHPGNNNTVWVAVNGVPILDSIGRIKEIGISFIDITERKLAEEKLLESEASVKRRLRVIEEPQCDIGEVHLSDIIDKDDLKILMEDFYRLSGAGSAVVDLQGNVLIAIGWQDICTCFHRVNPVTKQNCIYSDTVLTTGLTPGSVKLYNCKNGLWDAVTPIYIGENHIGNIFFGQFFFDDEVPDEHSFILQARQYGFEEEAYIAALNSVPRWSHVMIDRIMAFYARLATTISMQGYNNLRLARALSAHHLAEAKLGESEKLLSRAQEISHTGSWKLDLASNKLTWSDEVYRIFGCKPQEFAAGYEAFLDFVHPDDRAMVDAEYNRSLLEGNDDYEIVHKIIRRDSGEVCYVLERCIHERNEAGIIFQSTGMVQDITERMKAEELLSNLIENNPLSIQIVDKDGFTIKVNPAHTKLFGEQPPPGFSIFNDLQNKGHGEFILLAKEGKVVHFPDICYNVHDVIPELPDNPVWVRAILFPLTSSGNPERF
ncbi:MAG: PAS domain S-box protein, partial [Candidatus Cloacimonetes bacterium]|nr:PAS domain S-box protein [Candidatus Cloacimonadota bacterium]